MVPLRGKCYQKVEPLRQQAVVFSLYNPATCFQWTFQIPTSLSGLEFLPSTSGSARWMKTPFELFPHARSSSSPASSASYLFEPTGARAQPTNMPHPEWFLPLLLSFRASTGKKRIFHHSGITKKWTDTLKSSSPVQWLLHSEGRAAVQSVISAQHSSAPSVRSGYLAKREHNIRCEVQFCTLEVAKTISCIPFNRCSVSLVCTTQSLRQFHSILSLNHL